jgi:hypothetical protein
MLGVGQNASIHRMTSPAVAKMTLSAMRASPFWVGSRDQVAHGELKIAFDRGEVGTCLVQ